MGKSGPERTKQQRFMSLYTPVHERFVRFCYAHAYGDYDPNDLINETVLKAYENFHKLKDDGAFLHFLFGISKNVLRNSHRRSKFKGAYEEQQFSQVPDDGPSGEDRVDVGVLYEALGQLPKEQKEALILFEISGFSIKEIMEMQKAGESAVKARLARGRKKLAELLREPVRMDG